MGRSISKTDRERKEIIKDAEGAKEALFLWAAQHRMSIAHIIAAAHRLDVPYHKIFRIKQTDIIWVPDKQCYDVIITGLGSVIERIIPNVKIQDLYHLNQFWKYNKKPHPIELINFIRLGVDINGIAMSPDTLLPVGFFLDSSLVTNDSLLSTYYGR